jgi:hypothetical protein
MRRGLRLPLVVACGALLVVSSCAQLPVRSEVRLVTSTVGSGAAEVASAAPEVSRPPSAGWLLGMTLPTHISAIVSKFGKPTSVELPSEESLQTTPWGQWFRWKQHSTGYTVTALGDEYSRTPNHGAGVRYVELKVGPSKRQAKTLFGFELNSTSRREVVARFGRKLRPSDPNGNFMRAFHEDAMTYVDGDVFTFFFFGSDGRLIGVAQSTFNPDQAG